MRTSRAWMMRFGSWLTRQRDAERLAAELEEHLKLQATENLSAGMDEVEARRQAALKLGSVAAIRESYWDQKGWPWAESLLQDVRLAFRRLLSAPGFAVTSILILRLRAERRRYEIGFESQKAKAAAETRKDEIHQVRIRNLTARSENLELDTDIRGSVEAPLPGHAKFSFSFLKQVISQALVETARECEAHPELTDIFFEKKAA